MIYSPHLIILDNPSDYFHEPILVKIHVPRHSLIAQLLVNSIDMTGTLPASYFYNYMKAIFPSEVTEVMQTTPEIDA